MLPPGTEVGEIAAAVPEMAPGVMSAGLGRVPAAQTYLDIGQGNRLFTSLYPDPIPPLYVTGGRVPADLWAKVVARADGGAGRPRAGPARLDPGGCRGRDRGAAAGRLAGADRRRPRRADRPDRLLRPRGLPGGERAERRDRRAAGVGRPAAPGLRRPADRDRAAAAGARSARGGGGGGGVRGQGDHLGLDANGRLRARHRSAADDPRALRPRDPRRGRRAGDRPDVGERRRRRDRRSREPPRGGLEPALGGAGGEPADLGRGRAGPDALAPAAGGGRCSRPWRRRWRSSRRSSCWRPR